MDSRPSKQYLKLLRKNKRKCERLNTQTQQLDTERALLKRKLNNDEAYDKGEEEEAAATAAITSRRLSPSTGTPRPMSLVLHEMRCNNDPRLVYSDLVSHGRHQLTTKRQKRWNTVETENYLQARSLCQLLDWQENALCFIEARESDQAKVGSPGVMLCLEQGLGKTLISLAYQLYDNQRCFRQTGNRYNGCTLIPVPGSLLIDNWQAEVHGKWPPGTFEYHVLRSNKNRLLSRVYIENCCDFVLVTYATIKAAFRYRQQQEAAAAATVGVTNNADPDEDDLSDYDTTEEEEEEEAEEEKEGPLITKMSKARRGREYLYNLLYTTRWKRIIPDESHFFVNEQTLLFKAMDALHADIRWVVTGTPIQNRLSDICASFNFIRVPLSDALVRHQKSSSSLNKDMEVSDEDKQQVKAMLAKVMIRVLKSEINRADNQMVMMPVVKTIKLIEFESLQEKVIYYLYATYGSHNRGGAATAAAKSQKRTNVAAILQLMMQLCIGVRVVDGLVLPGGMLTLGNTSELLLKETATTERLFSDDERQYEANDHTLERFASTLAEKRTSFSYKSSNNNVINLPAGYNLEYFASLQSKPVTELDNSQCNQESFDWEPFKADPVFDLSPSSGEDRAMYRSIYETLCEEGPLCARRLIKEAKKRRCVKTPAMVKHIIARALREPHYSSKNRHILKYIQEEVPADDMIIVFTNSIRSMECLARDLTLHGLTSIIVNGTTRDNNDRIARFKEGGARVLILSFKLGNVGLNITCANHVIFLHPWWNPNMTDQAEKRADRLGQLKVVHIVHFIMNHTIDLYVLNLSHNKKSMTSSIIGKQGTTTTTSPTSEKDAQIERYAYSLYEYSFHQ